MAVVLLGDRPFCALGVGEMLHRICAPDIEYPANRHWRDTLGYPREDSGCFLSVRRGSLCKSPERWLNFQGTRSVLRDSALWHCSAETNSLPFIMEEDK